MIEKGLLKGTLKTIILKMLQEHGQMYGYEMTQKVKDLSLGELELTEGALYPMLHKLEADGLVSIEKVSVGKRIRKYYRLTPQGSSETSKKLAEFQHFIQTMELILHPNMRLGKI